MKYSPYQFSGLVTCDSLHIIFGIMESVRTSWKDLYHDNLLYIFPWFHYPFYRITLVSSIYMMIAVAIERFFAVCFPHNYHNLNAQRNRAWYYIVPAIAAAFLIQIPRFLETEFVPRQVNVVWIEMSVWLFVDTSTWPLYKVQIVEFSIVFDLHFVCLAQRCSWNFNVWRIFATASLQNRNRIDIQM